MKLMLIFLLSFFSWASYAQSPNPKIYYAAVPPIKGIIQAIGGQYVRAESLVGAQQNHELFEPRPSQLSDLAQAHAYFNLRLPFEQKWTAKFNALQKKGKTIDLLEKVAVLKLADHDHAHPKKSADKEGLSDDPHIWLAPPELRQIAEKIFATLSADDPANQAYFQNHLQIWLGKLDEKDRALKSALALRSSAQVIADHPNWGYFARYYGLTMINLEEGDRQLSPKQLQQITADINAGRVRWALIERRVPTFLRQAKTVKVVEVQPSQEDVLTLFAQIAQRLNEQ